MMRAVLVVFFLFASVFAAEKYCSGEGETECNETTNCEETHYRDIRMSTAGCCQRCVKKLREYMLIIISSVRFRFSKN